MGPRGSPRFEPSRNTISGSFTVTGSLIISGSVYITGNLDLSGSTKFGSNLSHTHQRTGSFYVSGSNIALSGANYIQLSSSNVQIGTDYAAGKVSITGSLISISGSTQIGRNSVQTHQISGSWVSISGNLYVEGTNTIKIGSGPAGIPYYSSTAIGIDDTVCHTTSSLYIYSNKFNNPSTGSIILSAHPNVATISESHPIVEIGWRNSSNVYAPSWYITENEISSSERSSAQALGSETDAANAIGTIVGSSELYSTAGAKLFSVLNGTGSNERERENTDYYGNKVICKSDYTGSTTFAYWSELVTVAAAASTSTVNTIPAGALCYGVGCYVVTSIPDTTYFYIGTAGTTDKWGHGLIPSASITNLTTSQAAGMEYYATNTSVQITPNVNPSAATGKVRVEARYIVVTPPQN